MAWERLRRKWTKSGTPNIHWCLSTSFFSVRKMHWELQTLRNAWSADSLTGRTASAMCSHKMPKTPWKDTHWTYKDNSLKQNNTKHSTEWSFKKTLFAVRWITEREKGSSLQPNDFNEKSKGTIINTLCAKHLIHVIPDSSAKSLSVFIFSSYDSISSFTQSMQSSSSKQYSHDG